MKKKDKLLSLDKVKKIPDKYIQVPLVPAWVLLPLWFISLALPNLVYSGVKFADTLHVIKWTVTGVPIAIAVLVAGVRLLIYGRDKIRFKIDLFALVWALLLAYAVLQTLWVKLFSPTGYVLEMVCFVAVWAFYVISVASFPDNALRYVLILGNLNAAINVLYAELQIRNLNDFSFLNGTIFESLKQFSSIILPTPGNYIGNTAQQNMFGLWAAVGVLGAIYLFVYDAWRNDSSEHGKKIYLPAVSLALGVISMKFAVLNENILFAVLAVIFLLGAFVLAFVLGNDKRVYYSVFILFLAAINLWGLLNSTSRSGFLALVSGSLVMLIIAAWKFNRNYVIRFGAVLIVLAAVFWVSTSSSRAGGLVEKTADIIEHAENIGNRRGIWMTSYAMLMEHPKGVGTGQYKWHYLEAQREGFKTVTSDWYTWQYTHWAHNEFLQWFCEGGWIGGIILIVMYLTWFIPALMGLIKRQEININAVWALGLTSLITFCAIFTRPFHRIENMVWITLAFALSNREFISEKFKFTAFKSKSFMNLIGLVCIVSSIAGILYISDGIYGNYVLRQALSTQNPSVQIALLEEAAKHPIVYEEAQRNIGYHYIQLGEQTNDRDLLAKGFNTLWGHFNREPHSEDISRLLNFAQKYQVQGALIEIVSYFKPGTYHLVRQRHKTPEGQEFDALVLANGPEPGK
ncbi:MAG: O-antigen ligase family protein [Synergistaceae bacterium]|nr:O-antigen ligase family protein [Synergistaceae bacterium]